MLFFQSQDKRISSTENPHEFHNDQISTTITALIHHKIIFNCLPNAIYVQLI